MARFETVVHPLLEIDGEVVSSSHIRGLVAAGEVEQAERFLGAPFQLRGTVVEGDAAAVSWAFPRRTSCRTSAWCCPGHGVYACLAESPRRDRLARGREHRRAPDFHDGPG